METVLAEMTRRLVREFAPEQVILFGSHAWGEPNADSDVDLFVVVKDSDETPFQRGLRARGVLTGMGVSEGHTGRDTRRVGAAADSHRLVGKSDSEKRTSALP